MIRSLRELPVTVREAIRNGCGRALVSEILAAGEMSGVAAFSHLTLEAGASIGAGALIGRNLPSQSTRRA